MAQQKVEIEIHVSQPYTLIAGGYTSLRPVGQRRDYTAEVNGRVFKDTSKSNIQSVIRHYVYRATGQSVRFNFTQEG